MATPTLTSFTVQADGTSIRLVWSVAVADQGGETAIYDSRNNRLVAGTPTAGDGTTTLDYSPSGMQVYTGEPVYFEITSGSVTAVSGGEGNATVARTRATNSATAVWQPRPGRRFAAGKRSRR